MLVTFFFLLSFFNASMPGQDGKELEEFVAANSDVVSAAPDGLEVKEILRAYVCIDVEPFRTEVPFWGQANQLVST